ncbi:MAG: hypothetical protein ABI728_03885, partial [Betaproteobacteria bacterium]
MKIALTRPMAVRIAACLMAPAAIGFVLSVAAQTGPGADDASIEAIKGRLASVQARQDLESALKTQIIETYRSAIAALESADSARVQTAKTRKTQVDAQETVPRLERELRSVRAESALPEKPAKFDALPLDMLERLENRTREEAEQARLRVAELQRQLDDLVARPLSARLEQAELRAQVAAYDAQATQPSGDSVAAELAAAQRDFARATETLRQARLARVGQEIIAQPVLERIAQLQLQIAQAQFDAHAADRIRVRVVLEQRQRAEIAKARAEAARVREPGAGPLDPALEIQARILERRAQVAEVSLAVSEGLVTLSKRREQLGEIDQTLRATKLRATTATEGGELDKLLLGQLRALPAPDQFRKAAERRAAVIVKAADARLDVELERAKIADLDHAVAHAMAGLDPGLPVASREKIEEQVRINLAELQRLLDRADKELDVLLQTLRAGNEAESMMLRRAQDFRAELIGLLLWIPVSPAGLETFAEIGAGAAWMVAGDNWRGVVATWQLAAKRSPALVLLAMLVLIALLAARGWFKRKLPTLAPGTIPLHAFRLHHTLEALALSLLLALPVPFAIWMAGFMLEVTHDVPLFAQSTGAALRLAAGIVLFFRTIRWLFDSSGVAIKHLSWNMEPVLAARRALRQLMILYVPLVFVAALATIHAPEPVRQSLGRMAFVLAMIAPAVFWRRAFHPHRPL